MVAEEKGGPLFRTEDEECGGEGVGEHGAGRVDDGDGVERVGDGFAGAGVADVGAAVVEGAGRTGFAFAQDEGFAVLHTDRPVPFARLESAAEVEERRNLGRKPARGLVEREALRDGAQVKGAGAAPAGTEGAVGFACEGEGGFVAGTYRRRAARENLRVGAGGKTAQFRGGIVGVQERFDGRETCAYGRHQLRRQRTARLDGGDGSHLEPFRPFDGRRTASRQRQGDRAEPDRRLHLNALLGRTRGAPAHPQARGRRRGR